MTEGKSTGDDALQDTKAKMRAALDRKKAAEHASADSARNTGNVHGSEVAGPGGRKMFRRKSG